MLPVGPKKIEIIANAAHCEFVSKQKTLVLNKASFYRPKRQEI